MIVCKVCGHQNEVGAQFCGNCGSFLEWSGEPTEDTTVVRPASPVPEPAPAPGPGPVAPPLPQPQPEAIPPGSVICPVCGTANEPTRVYCRSCATELAAAMPPDTGATGALPPLAPGQSGGGGRIPPAAIVGLGAVGVVLVGGLVFFALSGGKTPDPTSSLGPTTAASSTPSPSVATASPSATPSPSVTPTPLPEPSGPILVVLAKEDESDRDIAIVQPDGSGMQRLITAGNTGSPSWAPDKSQFVYVRSGSLRIANADGSGDHVLEPPARLDAMPAWSPDGERILFNSRRDGDFDLYTVSVDGGGTRQLTDEAGVDRGGVYSPDGTKIAFISDRDGSNDIWVMDADGDNQVNLTESDDAEDVDPAWSPDGSTIVFASRTGGDPFHLFFMNPDGANMRPAVEATDEPDDHPDWSPDGNYLVFHRGENGHVVLIATLDGTIVGEIRRGSEYVRLPSWQ